MMLSARKKYLERCASLRLGLEDDGGSSEEDDESSITHVDSLEEDKRGAAPVQPNAQDNDGSSCVLASIEYNSSPPPTPSKVLSKSLSRLSSPSLFRRQQRRRSCKTTSPRSCLDFDRVSAALSTNDEETSSECYDDADPPEDYVKCSFLDETDLLNISLAKKEEEKEVSAATTISAAYRGYYARQSLLVYDIIRVVEYSMTPSRCRDVNASILIQRAYRGYREYIKYVVKQYASIRIQRAYCDYVARQSILRDAHVRDVNAATRIQRGWRKFWTLINVECATIILQSWFRKCVAQHKTRYLSIMVDAGCIMVEEKSSVLTIQKWWRDNLNEWRILNEAAIVMQSCFRGYREYIWFGIKLVSVIQIQACIRSKLVRCNGNRLKRNNMEHAAATVIQSYFRGFQAFVRYVIITNYFILKLQARVRGYQTRIKIKQLKTCKEL